MKLTKQGVRDLDDIPGKSQGKKLEEPPKGQFCKHPRRRSNSLTGEEWCLDCGLSWDWEGRQYLI